MCPVSHDEEYLMPNIVIVPTGLLLGKIGCGGCGETRHHSHPVENWQRLTLYWASRSSPHRHKLRGLFLFFPLCSFITLLCLPRYMESWKPPDVITEFSQLQQQHQKAVENLRLQNLGVYSFHVLVMSQTGLQRDRWFQSNTFIIGKDRPLCHIWRDGGGGENVNVFIIASFSRTHNWKATKTPLHVKHSLQKPFIWKRQAWSLPYKLWPLKMELLSHS